VLKYRRGVSKFERKPLFTSFPVDTIAEGLRERQLIDLVDEHRVNSLFEGHAFPSMAAATNFMQDCAFNNDKRIKKASHGGKQAKDECSNTRCVWNAFLYRRASTDGKTEYRVVSICDEHSDFCFSFGRPNQRQVQLLRTFVGAVSTKKTVKRRDVQHDRRAVE